MDEDFLKGNRKKTTSDPKANILTLQIVAAVIFLLAAFVIRSVGGQLYTDIREIYYSAVNDDTFASEVMEPQAEDAKTSSDVEPTGAEPIGEKTVPAAVNNSDESEPVEVNDDTAKYIFDFESIKSKMSLSASASNSLQWPLDGTITSGFGYRTDPISGEYLMHGGIDIAADWGTAINAAATGTVTSVGVSSTYGNYLMITHNDNLVTLYAHCSTIVVKEGNSVKKGQQVACVGTTGRSTGPHLHFETRVGGYKANPVWLLPEKQAV